MPPQSTASVTPGAYAPAAVYRRLLGISAPYWRIFVVAALSMAIYAVTDTGFAFLMNNLIKTLTPEELSPELQFVRKWLPLAIMLLFIVRGVVAFLSAYCLGWIGRQVIRSLRGEAFRKFLTLPIQYFDRTSAGELLSKLTYNVEQIAEATSNVVTVLIRDTLTVICLLAYMIYLSPPLTAILLVVGPLMALVIRFLSKLFRRHSARIQTSIGDVAKIAEEALQSIRIVKIFSGQKYENERFDEVNDKNMRLNMRLIMTQSAGDALINIVIAISVAGVIFFSTVESVRPADSGDFVGFITAMIFLLRPIRQLTNMNISIQRGIAAGSSIFYLLDHDEEKDTGRFDPVGIKGRVEFRDINFTYSADKGAVLEGINLIVPAGETLAIVGRSGSGKSTLVNLLPRFYDPESGSILIDDTVTTDFRLSALREQISLVSQDVVLFDDTVARNIAYGALGGASREEIEAAAHAAHVDEFVNEFPDGLETQVGDRGVLMSGGQRQRIAIARALLKNSPILILDEATSALDTQSERHIQQALQELMKNRTTFVIAHRLSTVENADRIIVMARGRIVEQGSHSELIAAAGHYARLHQLQFKDELV